jgi:sulfatase maturation enzyme AslB (radical SAM superfamily)
MIDVTDRTAATCASLDFLWLELTNQCNLECSHCYAESGPYTPAKNGLNRAQYRQLIAEAFEAGCRRIQFIGGEPTLNRDMPELIELCSNLGYTFVEVFTNLTRLRDGLLACLSQNGVHVATSVYAPTAEIHDKITHFPGSFAHTVSNLRKLLEYGIPVRVGVIEMQQNSGQVGAAVRFIKNLGIQNVGTDRLRHFGRGGIDNNRSNMTELCGQCADKLLCVSFDGKVSPCIMSKSWSVGSMLDTPFDELITSERLAATRRDIYRATVQGRDGGRENEEPMHAICTPKTCGPYSTCTPTTGPGPCAPNGCTPCFPKG